MLKAALGEFAATQHRTAAARHSLTAVELVGAIAEMGKAMTGYLHATADGGKHAKMVQLIDSLAAIAALVSAGTVSAAAHLHGA